ncbi:hypothetical protein [Rufibacter sp. LB8]|uniref:hypothetical protein n=1 Tax=Rufibacter sp. LB8 TaxID=2777781 RepID=UPI00178C2B69|nr:hypothetical protein [Rufibacter sp. LB8]
MVSKEPDFTIFSHHSAAMLLKNGFARTFRSHLSPAKSKFKQALNIKKEALENLLGLQLLSSYL